MTSIPKGKTVPRVDLHDCICMYMYAMIVNVDSTSALYYTVKL